MAPGGNTGDFTVYTNSDGTVPFVPVADKLKEEALAIPAIGDDREGTARALRRLAEMPQFADKSGLVMQLQVAANVVMRADHAIQKLTEALKSR
jgi:hypothetical protein